MSTVIHDLTPAELQARLSTPARPRVVDVRETSELTAELGHIAGIEHVPLASLPQVAARWPHDEDIVVVCRSGGRSGKAAQILAQQGFRRILNLAGGMQAWNAAALPTQRKW